MFVCLFACLFVCLFDFFLLTILCAGDRTNNDNEGTNSGLVKDVGTPYPDPPKAVRFFVKHLKRAELKKLRKADLQIGQKKKSQYTRMALQRIRLKKELMKKGSLEERVKHMSKYMVTVASNLVMTTQGSKTGNHNEEVGENVDDSNLDGNLSREPSLVQETEDPYAHMVIGGKKKRKANTDNEEGTKDCTECPVGFNSKSKKVSCVVCDKSAHRYHLTVDDDPENYKCSVCEPKRKRKHKEKETQAVAVVEINFDCGLCEFVSRHRYNFKRHLKRMHGRTEAEAEEQAKEEDKKKTNDIIEEQEEGEVVQQEPAEEEHQPQEQQQPEEDEEQLEDGHSQQQIAGELQSVKEILKRVNLEKHLHVFEEELITLEILKTTSAFELRQILNIPFGSLKTIMDEVARCKVTSAPTVDKPAFKVPIDYPSSDFYETWSCGKCLDRFITEGSLKEHMKEEHMEKEARCIVCNLLAKTQFKLNEHIADKHPMPRRVQDFGNYHIEDGMVVFSDEEDDDDDYDVSKEDTEESEEEYEEEGAEDGMVEEEAAEDEDEEGEVEDTEEEEEAGDEECEVEETLEEEYERDGDDMVGTSSLAEKTLVENTLEVEESLLKEAGQQQDETIAESYPCKECSSVFSFRLPLKSHIKNNHVGKLKCDECNYRANTIRKLEHHERDLHGPVDGEPVLGEANNAMDLVENIFAFGKKRKPKPTQLLKQKKSKTDGRFACEDCDCDYSRRDGLKKHRAAKH